eukprot:1146623-Pelagomonas_calceolata.AAC.2
MCKYNLHEGVGNISASTPACSLDEHSWLLGQQEARHKQAQWMAVKLLLPLPLLRKLEKWGVDQSCSMIELLPAVTHCHCSERLVKPQC